jgi:putative zinc finger protein
MNDHPKDDLIGYAAGTLPPAARWRVDDHLAGCAGCRVELAGWGAVAGAVQSSVDLPPSAADLVTSVLRRAALEPAASLGTGDLSPDVVGSPAARRWRGWGFWRRFVRAQGRLVGRAVWVVSALVMVLWVGVAALRGSQVPDSDWLSTGFALVTPIVAAAGVAAVCGPARQPAFEYEAATRTSPRLVLLVRCGLVFGYDALLAVACSAVAGAVHGGLVPLLAAWFGPMGLLAAVSLALAVRFGPNLAVAGTVALWCGRVLAGGDGSRLAGAVDRLWSTNLLTGLITLALVGLALLLVGRYGSTPRTAS